MVGNDVVFDVVVPETQVHEIAHHILVCNDKLPRKRPPIVDIARNWFDAFVVAEDLRGRRRWHRRHQERVP